MAGCRLHRKGRYGVDAVSQNGRERQVGQKNGKWHTTEVEKGITYQGRGGSGDITYTGREDIEKRGGDMLETEET